jgi:hypothetical protein
MHPAIMVLPCSVPILLISNHSQRTLCIRISSSYIGTRWKSLTTSKDRKLSSTFFLLQIPFSGFLLFYSPHALVDQFCCSRFLTHINWMCMPSLDFLIYYSPSSRCSNFLGPLYARLKRNNGEIRFSIYISLDPTDPSSAILLSLGMNWQ